MKYKIYLVASLLLGNIFLGFSQSKDKAIEKVSNDSVETRAVTRASSAGQLFQEKAGIYGFGASQTAANTNLQTVGGASNNFNAVIPGRDVPYDDATATADQKKVHENASSRESVMRSNGPMYIADNGANSTTMAVFGSMFFDMSDTNTKVGQKGNLDLYGDLIAIEDNTVTPTTPNILYQTGTATVGNTFNPEGYKSADSYTNTGLITFKGKWNVQRIAVEDETGLPIVSSSAAGKAFKSILNLPKVKVDKETLSGLTTAGNTLTTVAVADQSAYDPYRMGFVSVGSNVAVSINELDITGGNRLSVDAISSALEAKAVADATGTAVSGSLSTDAYYKVNYGYLDINSQVAGDGVVGLGYGELNMRLYSFNPDQENTTISTDGLFQTTSTTPNMTDPTNDAKNVDGVFLRGFTSPFDKMYADYMLYNVLTKPEESKMTGPEGTITPPETPIERGEGYFFALDVSDAQFARISEKNQLGNKGYNSRARGGYNFSRYLRQFQFTPGLNNDRFIESGSRTYGYETAYAANFYTFNGEAFTTTTNPQRFNAGAVAVTVKGGSDYLSSKAVLLGNPYLVPINIGGILWDGDIATDELSTLNGMTEAQILAAYKTIFKPKFNGVESTFSALINATDPTIPPSGSLVIRSKYKPVISARVIDINDQYAFNVNYDEVDLFRTAATAASSGDANEAASLKDYYLEPLQLFGIEAVGEGDFTFIPEMKTNGVNGKTFAVSYSVGKNTNDTRSLASDVYTDLEDASNKVIIPDWFVIEANIAEDVLSTDRTAVRFMNSGSQSYVESRDVIKNMKYLSNDDNLFENDKTRALVRAAQSNMNVENSIYTTALDGTPLKSNTTDYASTKEIPLYYVPSKNGGEVTLNFTGVSGFQNIKKASLVDRYENKKTDLEEGLSYSFTSAAGTQDNTNRFLLVFDDESKNDKLPSTNFIVYYTESVLHIDGLNDQDAGSVVQIFDVQGRTMGTTTISSGEASVGSKEYPKPLGLGTFIVKIIGKRNYNTKFVNTQNI